MARSIREFLGTATNNYLPPGGTQGQGLVKKTNIDFDVEWRFAQGEGGGVTAYETIASLPLTGNNSGSMAFVEENNRLYIWNGVGWFNIALINTSPTITQGPNPSYVFATDGTPIVITLLASDPEGIPITWSSQVTSGTLGNTAVITQAGNVFTITPSTSDEDAGSFGVTFTASDGVNIATAASSFTLVFAAADQFYNQSVVLTTSSVNNGNNSVFVDSSTNNFAITRNGNTTQGTFSPFSPAGWSAYFDGSGDYLDIPSNAAFGYGTGDFTIEFWGYFTVFGSTPNLIDQRAGISTQNVPTLYLNGSVLTYYVNGSNRITGATLVTNRWYHIALCRGSGSTRIFVDGVQTGSTFVDSTNYIDSPVRIFASRDAGTVQAQAGYCSNVRIVNGTALYTTNFTPPTTPLTAVSGTSLLTLQDNRFIDRSTNNFAITRTGDVRITAFSPFIPQTPYNASVHGGSAYFDGTGDFLSVPSNAAFNLVSGDFTIETWFYWTGVNTNFKLFDKDGVFGTSYSQYSLGASGSTLVAGVGSGNGVSYVQDISTGVSAPVRQWTHIAFTKNGTTLRVFVNGILAVTATQSGTMVDGGKALIVGYISGQPSSHFFDGYMTGTRIVKGTALYTANFTPPTEPITAVANTSLLLNFTNANIFDETGKVVVETVGTGQVNTSIVRFGSSSMFFNGSGNRAFIPPTDLLGFAAGDWTIECWIYPTTLGDYYLILDNRGLGDGVGLYVRNGLEVANNSNVIAAGGSLTTNTWAHVAFTRNNGVLRGFINGSSVLSVSDIRTYAAITNATVGGGYGTVQPFFGYISDLRITKGRARYTANFTPPTAKLGYNNAE